MASKIKVDTLETANGSGSITLNNPISGFTSTGIDDNATSTAITIDASENVGIGNSSPSAGFRASIKGDYSSIIGGIEFDSGGGDKFTIGHASATSPSAKLNVVGAGNLIMQTNNTEAMRIDSSANLLVNKTSQNMAEVGAQFRGDAVGLLQVTRDGAEALHLNRLTTGGDIAKFYVDSTAFGSIGSSAGLYIAGAACGIRLHSGGTKLFPTNSTGGATDGTVDLGASGASWKDIYASNGTIITSDRNKKQDIEELSESEQSVAVACKGLLRKFRWKDAVAEKGDDARIHFGIIAQDLQDAFTAEGLDAGRYGMFISTTWWETQTEVPSVEAVDEGTDEEGNVTTEAVEAKDAYTRTDNFNTLEEAPEGATERTRLGVRYSELLSFIIAAL